MIFQRRKIWRLENNDYFCKKYIYRKKRAYIYFTVFDRLYCKLFRNDRLTENRRYQTSIEDLVCIHPQATVDLFSPIYSL